MEEFKKDQGELDKAITALIAQFIEKHDTGYVTIKVDVGVGWNGRKYEPYAKTEVTISA